MNQPELKFLFTPHEIDRMANILAEKPYKEVHDLLYKIQVQANSPQLQGLTPPSGDPQAPAQPLPPIDPPAPGTATH